MFLSFGEVARISWEVLERQSPRPARDYVLPYTMGGQTIHIKTPCWKIDGEDGRKGLTGRMIGQACWETGFVRQIEWYYQPVEDQCQLADNE